MAFASHWIMLGLLLGFAVAHSGLASLRMRGEAIIGARLYRVLFALVSIPLALILVVYFFNHRYDGLLLWQVQGVTGVQTCALPIYTTVPSFFRNNPHRRASATLSLTTTGPNDDIFWESCRLPS